MITDIQPIQTNKTYVDPMLGRFSVPTEVYPMDLTRNFHPFEVEDDLLYMGEECPDGTEELLNDLTKHISVCHIPDLESIPGSEQGGVIIRVNNLNETDVKKAVTVLSKSADMNELDFIAFCNSIDSKMIGEFCVADQTGITITLPQQGPNVLFTDIGILNLIFSKIAPPRVMPLDDLLAILSNAKVDVYDSPEIAQQAIKVIEEQAELESQIESAKLATPTNKPVKTKKPTKTPLVVYSPTPPLSATTNTGMNTPVGQTDLDLTPKGTELPKSTQMGLYSLAVIAAIGMVLFAISKK